MTNAYFSPVKLPYLQTLHCWRAAHPSCVVEVEKGQSLFDRSLQRGLQDEKNTLRGRCEWRGKMSLAKNLCGTCTQLHAPFSNTLAKELYLSLKISTSADTKPGGRRLTAIKTRRLTGLGSFLEEASRIPSYSSFFRSPFWYSSSMMSFACNSCTNRGKTACRAASSTSATFSLAAMLCDQGSPLCVHSRQTVALRWICVVGGS